MKPNPDSRHFHGRVDNCPSCHHPTEDDELVVNWGVCNICFDKGYEEYLRSPHVVARDAVEEQGIGE